MQYDNYRAQLKTFPSVDGDMAYLDQGSGPVILLVHGVPTSSWLYRSISTQLVDQGYRVIAPDMLGYGASAKPKGYDIYNEANTGRRLSELMQHLAIDRWTQVFHDGGGLWTWEMLKLDASRVERLIMLNTIVYQPGFKPPLKFEKGLIAKLYTKLYCSPLGQPLLVNGTFKNGIKNKAVINKEMLAGYKKPLRQKGHRALYYFFTQTCREIPDYTTLHQSLNIPLHVIWGQHDDMLVWDHIAEEVKNNFRLSPNDIQLLDAKHFIQEELPDEIAQKILVSMAT